MVDHQSYAAPGDTVVRYPSRRAGAKAISSIGNVVYEPGKRGVDLFARMSERPLGTKHDLKCGVELKERFYEIVLVPSPALAHPRFGIVAR